MNKLRGFLLVGALCLVTAGVWSTDVTAKITVGSGIAGDTTVEFEDTDIVTNVRCSVNGSEMRLTMTYIRNDARSTQTAVYNEPTGNNWVQSDCDSKVVAVTGGNLKEIYQEESTSSGGGAIGAPDKGECASILPDSWCEEDEDGVSRILQLVLNIMTAGVGILATIGLVISGMQWMTARDKEDQVVRAKSRIFNIVIGIAVWALMWLIMTWLLPGGIL